MSIYKQTSEEVTTDLQEMSNRIFSQHKNYIFFIYHNPAHISKSCIQKLSFKLKQQKGTQPESKYHEHPKNINMNFYDHGKESDIYQSMSDLKSINKDIAKVKIVVYGGQSVLIHLVQKGCDFQIDLNNVPFLVVDQNLLGDLALFMGWNSEGKTNFYEKSTQQLETLAKKWINTSQEKLDLWNVQLKFHNDGRLEKVVSKGYEEQQLQKNSYFSSFISHFSLGHHPKVAKKYEMKRDGKSGCTYGWQKFKNFCCLGKTNIKNSTGVVSIIFKDDNGQQYEILKHLVESDSDESQPSPKLLRSDQILSLLLTNINHYHQQKLSTPCKPNDSKLEFIVFEGANKNRKIMSVGGEIIIKFETEEEEIYIQIGNCCYRMLRCKEIRIKMVAKVKVAINKNILGC